MDTLTPAEVAQLLGTSPEQTLRGLPQQPRGGAIHEGEFLILVEGKDGDVDLRHDLAQERRRLERVESLVTQRFDE